MAYFLRKDKRKKGLYLQICDSYRVKGTGKNKTTVFKTLGYETDIKSEEIPDPISYYSKIVKKMNEDRQSENSLHIDDEQQTKNIGFCLYKWVANSTQLFKDIKVFDFANNKSTNFSETLENLIYARAFFPCSKYKTYNQIFKKMYLKNDAQLRTMYDALEFFGNDYEKMIQSLRYRTRKIHKYDTNQILFDCTNFYFEIDKEDELRRRGPSKEMRRDPIIEMALMLDTSSMPIAMKLFPGNQSEKPQLREMIDDMKTQNEIKGRTIQIADKGLNCAKNIHSALISGDGYIFSKSVKQLPAEELKWLLLDNQYKVTQDQTGEVTFKIKSAIDDYEYEFIQDDGSKVKFITREIRVITWNKKLHQKKVQELDKVERKLEELILSKAKKEAFGFYSDYIDIKCFDKNREIIEGKVKTLIKKDKIEKERKLAGYNMLVSSEIKTSDIDIYNFYHQLWRIEKTFRLMKTDFEARPVYLQTHESIYAHFLIIYTCVLLTRILAQDVFENKFSEEDILTFIREFNVTKGYNGVYTNNLTKSPFVEFLAENYSKKIMNLYLSEKDLDSLMKIKL